jgi:tetratricopeptide (TPR) repeat protein
LYIKRVELKNGEKKLREITNSPDSLFLQIKGYAGFSLGNIFFFQNNFDSAATYYSRFLETSSDNHFKGIAALRLGLCHSFNNENELATKYFELSAEGNPDLEEDQFARVKGEAYLETSPDSAELLLVYSNNMIRSGKYKDAIDHLEEILSNEKISENIKAAALLAVSEASYFVNKFDQSLTYAITAFKLEKTEPWIKPFACYFAAKASIKLKNILDANLFIRYANNYSDYLYENKLKNLLYSLTYSIKK